MVSSLPHEVANLFIAEERIVSVLSRVMERPYLSSSFPLVDRYMENWSSCHRQLRPSYSLRTEKYFQKVLLELVGNPVHVFNLMDRWDVGRDL